MKAQIVSFHCILRNKVGRVISSTFNREVITHSDGTGGLLEGLAQGLQDLRKGEKRQISLSADQAYGFYDPRLVIEVSRKGLSQEGELQAGHEVMTQSNDGEVKVFRVVQISDRSVTLDGNHPLAGQDLVFDIEGIETREATSEELAEYCFRKTNHYFH